MTGCSVALRRDMEYMLQNILYWRPAAVGEYLKSLFSFGVGCDAF